MRVTVTFDANGNVQHIKSPDLDFLESLGQRKHIRASHVVPVNFLLRWIFVFLRKWVRDDSTAAAFTRTWPCRWKVDLAPSGGPVLGPFQRRSTALAAEREWIEVNVFGDGR